VVEEMIDQLVGDNIHFFNVKKIFNHGKEAV
jgi:hypothetical protein